MQRICDSIHCANLVSKKGKLYCSSRCYRVSMNNIDHGYASHDKVSIADLERANRKDMDRFIFNSPFRLSQVA